MNSQGDRGWPAIHPQGRAAVSLSGASVAAALPGPIPAAAAGRTLVAGTAALEEQTRQHHRTHRTRCRATAGTHRSWQPGMTVLDSPHIIPSRLQQGGGGASRPGVSPAPEAGWGQLEVQGLREQTSGWCPCRLGRGCAAGGQRTPWRQRWWAGRPLLLHVPPRTCRILRRIWSPPVVLARAGGKTRTVSRLSLLHTLILKIPSLLFNNLFGTLLFISLSESYPSFQAARSRGALRAACSTTQSQFSEDAALFLKQ